MSELLFRDDAYLKSCSATVIDVSERGIRLDRTVFYPTGGGQPGDIGVLRRTDGSTIAIADARKGDSLEDVLHIPAPGNPTPAVGETVTAEIDWDRRYRLMRMHTCLHLLCAVIPAAVTGGQISDGKARLDFDMAGEAIDKDAVTEKLNALIAADHKVEPRWITDEELQARPELVRTMSVKPPIGYGKVRLLDVAGVDLQPCGGTHIRHTAEIGRVEVTKIESKGKQNRRVNIAFAP